jgi:hypothetical protein
VVLVDDAGRTVVSRRVLPRLEGLTRSSDGALFAADAWGHFDFDAVAEELRRDAGAAPGGWVVGEPAGWRSNSGICCA